MKPIALVPLVLLVSGATGAATAALLREPRAAAAAAAPAPADLAPALRALEQQLEALARDNQRLSMELAGLSAAAARAPAEDLESAVARVLERRAAAATAGETPAAAPAAASDEIAFDARAAVDELLDPDLSEMQRQELWQKYAKQGRLDEIVALFEEQAAQHPDDPDAQVELGGAYLQKIFESGGGPMAGKWAMKADASFDTALKLDDQHWDARFSKAVSLSFWPPALGKQGEAIRQFETLVQQQEARRSEPRFAQTYLMLGNTYQQIGDGAKALATWQRGAGLFPDNEELAKQIANAEGR